MKFSILVTRNGYVLVVMRGRDRELFVYKEEERMAMLSHINDLLGPEKRMPS